MSTRSYDIPKIESQLKDLRSRADEYQTKLNTSPTALGGKGEPTSFDIGNQEKLQKLQKSINNLNNDRLRGKWYGNEEKKDNPDSEGKSQGFFMGTLDFISRPLYGMVGATKHLTGQGSESLWGDIADNMERNKNTFGDVLRGAHVPGGAAAPLGFALDVAFDPLNWLTMGSAALVPKIATGAIKGFKAGNTLKGLKLASKAGFLEKSAAVARFTPGVKGTQTFKKIGKTAMKATDEWEKFSGITAQQVVSTRGASGAFRMGLDNLFVRAKEAIPGSEKFLENYIYDPINWIEQSRKKDILQRALSPGITDVRKAVKAKLAGESIEPFLRKGTLAKAKNLREAEVLGKGKEPFVKGAKGITELDKAGELKHVTAEDVERMSGKLEAEQVKKMADAADEAVVNADNVASLMNDEHGIFVHGDPIENARNLLSEKMTGTSSAISLEELGEIVKSGSLDATGVKWFDKMMDGIKNASIKTDRQISENVKNYGKTTMNAYEKMMGIFRVAKVAASPSAHTNAWMGNTIMTQMMGIGLTPLFLKRVKQSRDYYKGVTGATARLNGLLREARGGQVAIDLAENIHSAGRSAYGDLSHLNSMNSGKSEIMEKIAKEYSMLGRDAGLISDSLNEKQLKDILDEIGQDAAMRVEDAANKGRSTFATSRAAAGKGNFATEGGAGMLSQDLLSNSASAEMFQKMAKKALDNPDNASAQVLNWVFNKMPESYEKIDQSFKLAVLQTGTYDGFTMGELRKLRQFVDIDPESLIKVSDEIAAAAGEMKYTVPAKTALEIGSVAYLNYAAMPAAVKVLRNMPIMGSPFISFMYGMTAKTGQTLIHNPSAFNKITFAMDEFGGDATPLEKKALDSKYYSYLKEQGMMRTPFFKENPVYLNMTNMIPYYSLNMFTPSNTKYGDSATEKLTEAWQKSPLMKDPIGSVLFDYLLQPLILKDGVHPQGQFGQPLYPLDATAIEKGLYGARTLVESHVPNLLAVAGPVVPEAAADYIPLYRGRSLNRAWRGKNSLGISSKESKTSRWIREMAKTGGISAQAPIDTTFTNKKK